MPSTVSDFIIPLSLRTGNKHDVGAPNEIGAMIDSAKSVLSRMFPARHDGADKS